MKNNQNINTDHFKKRLEKEQATLVAELKKIGHKNPTNAADWEPRSEDIDITRADKNEVADKLESFEGDTAIVNKLEPQLNDVKLALSKIKAGKYGICEVCGKEIEIERLEANPAARTCKAHLNS